MMRDAMIIASLTATPVFGETVNCMMAGDVPLSFQIDRTQFSPAQDANEPPRRKATVVQFGDKQFPATPFLIGDMRGFHSEALGGADAVFVLENDGAATYAVARTGEKQTGTCEVLQ
jgi:hypothetical protein